jgi:hypothetical protein
MGTLEEIVSAGRNARRTPGGLNGTTTVRTPTGRRGTATVRIVTEPTLIDARPIGPTSTAPAVTRDRPTASVQRGIGRSARDRARRAIGRTASVRATIENGRPAGIGRERIGIDPPTARTVIGRIRTDPIVTGRQPADPGLSIGNHRSARSGRVATTVHHDATIGPPIAVTVRKVAAPPAARRAVIPAGRRGNAGPTATTGHSAPAPSVAT